MSVLHKFAVTGAAVAALVLAAPTAAHAGTGVVRQGETRSHVYDNEPRDGSACIHLAVWYKVTLTYAPPTDVLTLTVGNESVSGNGASVRFMSGICTSFGYSVTGTSVAAAAAYHVQVTSGPLAALSDPAVAIGDFGDFGGLG